MSEEKIIEWHHRTAYEAVGRPSNLTLDVDVNTLVREAIQNSLDEKIDNGNPCKIAIKLITLQGDDKERLLRTLQWDALNKHIDAFTSLDSNAAPYRLINEVMNHEKISVLIFEDQNTTGLKGGEQTADIGYENKYFGLVRSANLSWKKGGWTGLSGGSYGAGKGVFWRFANSTVVAFSSTLQEEDLSPRENNPRFIAKSSGPSHKIEDNLFQGNGYLGVKDSNSETGDVVSLFGVSASETCTNLCIERDEMSSGTSVAIIGYIGDSDSPDDFDDDNQIDLLHEYVSEAYWRHIVKGDLEVIIERYEGYPSEIAPRSSIVVDLVPSVIPFANLYERYMNGKYTRLGKNTRLISGEVVVSELRVKLPKSVKGADPFFDETTASADLVIYVPKVNEPVEEKYLDRTCMFRGNGPTIRYDDEVGKNNEIGERFFALLVAGRARPTTKQRNLEKDKAMENYLKYCEDEGHTKWFKNRRRNQLKDYYSGTIAMAKRELHSLYTSTLKKYIIPEVQEGDDAPQELMRRFNFGKGSGRRKQKWELEVSGSKQNEKWVVTGSLSRKTDRKAKWQVSLLVSYKADAGGTAGNVDIEEINLLDSHPAIMAVNNNGVIDFDVPDHVSEIKFKAVTVNVGEQMPGKTGRILVRHRTKVVQ